MKILGYNYTVSGALSREVIHASGWHNSNLLHIDIASDLELQQKKSTMIHEIIEALNYSLDLKLEHNIVMSLEAGLYQVLVDAGVDLTPLLKDIT